MNFFHSFSKPTLEKKRYCCTEPVNFNNGGWVGGGQGQSCLVLAASPPPPAPFPKQIIYETYQVLS